MSIAERIPLMKGFWYIDEYQKDSTLYADQLG